MIDSPQGWVLALAAALCIGVSKAGFGGISLISVFLLADVYGAKASVGVALPLLIAADLTVYPLFRKFGSWRPVWRLLPPTLGGLLAGWWLLGRIDDETARRVIGGVILAMVLVQSLRRLHPEWFDRLARSAAFGIGAGAAGGIATMLANAAGPVIQLYLVSKRFGKMDLVGVGARFFLLVNLLKVPLSAGLELITPASLVEDLKLLPAVWIGIVAGKAVLRRVPQRLFEWLIIVFAIVAAVRLLVF